MDPAIIGAIGSILGGLTGGGKNEWVVPDYAAIRREAEAAGFNPMFALSMAPGQSGFSQNYMGSAIADAALMVADAASRKKDAGRLSQVEGENARLREQVQQMTLRPEVPGIYAAGRDAPTLRQALGVDDAAPSPVASGDRGSVPRDRFTGGDVAVRPLPEVSSVDPRRGVDNDPVKTHSGFMVVDNPSMTLEVPTLDGDEAFHWYDYPDLLLPIGKQFLEAQQKKAVSQRLTSRVYHKPYSPKGGPASSPDWGLYRGDDPDAALSYLTWLNRYAVGRSGTRRSVSGRDYQRY